MTINQIVRHYQETKCDVSFTQIYEYIYEKRDLVSFFTKRYKLDELDVESMINGKILEIADKFDGTTGKFRNAVFAAIKVGCIDLARKRNTKDKYYAEVMQEDDEGRLNELYEVVQVAPTTDENTIITDIQKKYDQRQLTAFLLSNTNEQTLTSALAFIQTDSYRKAAKLIGTTDKTVKSRIRSLSKRFDTNQFGNYYDYFTTATVHIG